MAIERLDCRESNVRIRLKLLKDSDLLRGVRKKSWFGHCWINVSDGRVILNQSCVAKGPK
jgi:hypothetical protein